MLSIYSNFNPYVQCLDKALKADSEKDVPIDLVQIIADYADSDCPIASRDYERDLHGDIIESQMNDAIRRNIRSALISI